MKYEKGVIILEASYCILVTVIILALLLSLGFFLYQNIVVTVVANEIAEELSQTYKLKNVDTAEDITASDAANVGLYRYMFNNADKLLEHNRHKAQNRAESRLSVTTLADDSNRKPKVEINEVVDDIGRRHYEVTVTQTYTFMLGDFLSLLGQDDLQTISRTVYVESSDVSHYINTVKFTDYALGEAKDLSKIMDAVDGAIGLLSSIFG